MAVEEDPPSGAPEWVVTYGDMMSLLLTFFIMLVSMSELKQDSGKHRKMMDAIRQAFGADFGKFGAPGNSLQASSLYNKISSLGMSSEGGLKISSRNAKGPGGAHRPVTKIRDGQIVSIGGPVVFERFSAELGAQQRHNLDVIAQVLFDKVHRVEVRGHASPEPLPEDSPSRDALDLSFARAQAVANYLASKGVDRRRLRVSAAGDTEPRTTARNKGAQAANHRVDVFLIDAYITPPTEGREQNRSSGS